MPRVRTAVVQKMLETEEQSVGQLPERQIQSTGPATQAAPAPSLVQVADRPVDKEWADMVAFSRQMVTININDSADKNAENPVFVGNNGEMPMVDGNPGWLFRNKDYTIERRFVESLCRAKITTYTQRDEVAPDGTPHKIMVPHTALRYPFRVVNDPHPRGADWLKAIMAEPA